MVIFQRWAGPVVAALMVASASVTHAEHTGQDRVFVNAKVFTSNTAQPHAEAFAVRGERILKVGTRAEAMASALPGAQIVDLGGKRVLPGLIDAHSHAVFAGLAALAPNLGDAEVDPADLEQRVQTWVSAPNRDPAVPLVIFGVNPGTWSDPAALSARFDADAWSESPLVLMGADYHTGWVNRAMRIKAGIDAKRVQALAREERHIIGAQADGEPNGILVDAGLDLVTAQLPKPDEALLLEAGRIAVRTNNEYGITAWMDPAANVGPGEALFSRAPGSLGTGILPAYRALAEADALTAHVAALLVASPLSDGADLDSLDSVRAKFHGIPNLTLPGIKIFADGVLEYPAQSAALLGTYLNSGQQGEMLLERARMTALVDAADARGWLVHVHALGDRAVRASLDAIAVARARRNSGIRHSITHLQLVDPADYPRFAQLNTIAVMQLHWAELDNYLIDLVQPYITETQFMGQYPAKSLQRHGAVIAGASDWPISTANPWEAMHHAMTRSGPDGGLNAAERLDRESMFLAYTLHAAQAIGLDQRIGSLEPGKQADFIVLDRDVLDVDVESLKETRVLETYFAGRKVSG